MCKEQQESLSPALARVSPLFSLCQLFKDHLEIRELSGLIYLMLYRVRHVSGVFYGMCVK